MYNHQRNNQNSRIKVYTSQDTFDRDCPISLEQKDFPIMNSVRQILLRENENGAGTRQFTDPKPKSNKTTESRESTQIIRERLRDKIDTLRERISSNHKNNTKRSIQERLHAPLQSLPPRSDSKNANIETMRVHSRDGSKSIEGSGLELDHYVSGQSSLKDLQEENKNYGNTYHQLNKNDTLYSASKQWESIKSFNTYQSKSKGLTESVRDQEINIMNKLSVTEENSYNNTRKNKNEYFTIEKWENAKEQIDPNSSQYHDSERNSATAYYIENSGIRPVYYQRSINSKKNIVKKPKSRNSRKHSSAQKSSLKRTTFNNSTKNYTMYKKSSAKKSKSSHKIKPYKKQYINNTITKSLKRPPRVTNLNNTENIKIVDTDSFLPTQQISENSSGIGSNLGIYDKELYQHETLSSRLENQPNENSFVNESLSRQSISPKRNKSWYKKRKLSKLSKPVTKTHFYRSSMKKSISKFSKLPPKYAKTVINSSEKKNVCTNSRKNKGNYHIKNE